MISLKDIKMEGTEVSMEVFLRTVPDKDRATLTEATYECLRRGWPVNRMELGFLARELRRKAMGIL